MLFDELRPHPFAGQTLHQGTQVIQVACQPVHAVDHDGVPVTHEAKQFGQGAWAVCGCQGGEVLDELLRLVFTSNAGNRRHASTPWVASWAVCALASGMDPREDVFDGPATGLPAQMSRGRVMFERESGPAAQVRHLRGYGPFIGFCTSHGESADRLAAEPARLVRFLRAFAVEIERDGTLSTAAAVFVGNSIAGWRADAGWVAYEGGFPTVGNREQQFEVHRLLGGLRQADDAMVRGLVSVLENWAQEVVDDSPVRSPDPVPPAAGQARYVRPALPAVTYYTAQGEPILYGGRWGDEEPPKNSYSVDSHTERFAGLHVVARALIQYLSAVYDVDVDTDPGWAADLLGNVEDAVEAVRVTPRSTGTASLTLVFTEYPGVIVHAGMLHDFSFPSCGCDACDETAETEADRLEMLVLAVAAGGYSERYPLGSRQWIEYGLTAIDGQAAEGGRSDPGPVPDARLLDAETRLRDIVDGWHPWPLLET